MYKGFYQLTSGMLSQTRRLDVIANNMTNVSTTGYKSDLYLDTSFDEYLVTRTGNTDKTNATVIGDAAYKLAFSEISTDFTQSALEPTGMPLHFAIEGDAFFAIDGPDEVGYTRSGAFALDDEGYLVLPDEGRVLDTNGAPIALGTDNIRVAENGSISLLDGTFVAQIGLYSFPDNAALDRSTRSLFVGAGAVPAAEARVHHQTLERSNIDLVKEMTNMMTAQRSLQSAAEISRMYDTLMGKIATELGRV